MMTNEVGKLLTASEVADMLHLHVNTVKRLGDRGELPFFRVCKRGDRRFRYDDVIEFLRRAKYSAPHSCFRPTPELPHPGPRRPPRCQPLGGRLVVPHNSLTDA